MPRSTGNTIADSLELTLGYAERLLKDIPADQFARFAKPGGQQVVSNHPAFIYGHLSLYPPRILEQLDRTPPPVPPQFDAVFSKNATCTDDPEGTLYPPMESVTGFFFDGYRAALTAFREATEEQLAAPNPTEAMAARFPTIGSLHNFYVGGHMMLHLGQLSAWRRMIGLGAA